jgi:hypothetical protein
MRGNSVNLAQVKKNEKKIEKRNTLFPLSFGLVVSKFCKHGSAADVLSTRHPVERADELQGRREPCPL